MDLSLHFAQILRRSTIRLIQDMISCKVIVIGLSAAQAILRRVAEFFCVSSGVYAMRASFLHQVVVGKAVMVAKIIYNDMIKNSDIQQLAHLFQTFGKGDVV